MKKLIMFILVVCSFTYAFAQSNTVRYSQNAGDQQPVIPNKHFSSLPRPYLEHTVSDGVALMVSFMERNPSADWLHPIAIQPKDDYVLVTAYVSKNETYEARITMKEYYEYLSILKYVVMKKITSNSNFEPVGGDGWLDKIK